MTKRKRPRRSTRKPGARRVLLQRPGSTDLSAVYDHLGKSKYEVRSRPIVRLTANGIDWGAWPEPGDEIGYAMSPHRGDDCLRAAIATCTQVPIEQVPDLALDNRFEQGEDVDEISRLSWERIDAWAQKRGLQLAYSPRPPLPLERWVGVVKAGPLLAAMPREYWMAPRRDRYSYLTPFQDHCLVMRREEILFDPTCSLRAPAGARQMRFNPSDVDYGIAFVKEDWT